MYIMNDGIIVRGRSTITRCMTIYLITPELIYATKTQKVGIMKITQLTGKVMLADYAGSKKKFYHAKFLLIERYTEMLI
jgi:hypothetical protein